MKKTKHPEGTAPFNPVAKHAHQFNKAYKFSDKTKYNRKAKHREPESMSSGFKQEFRIA